MNQFPPPNSDPQSSMPEPGIRQMANNSAMGGGMQAVKGNNNIQNQGNNNLILVFNQDIDPSAIAISFKQLAENHPDAELRDVEMEVRGEDELLLRARTNSNADKSQLKAEYFSTYKQNKSLPNQVLSSLLAEKAKHDHVLKNLINMILEELERHPHEQQRKQVRKKIFDDHKYDGRLVTILLEIYEEVPSEKVCAMLTIAFGNPEVKIPDLEEVGKSIDIKFGIKAGELCFSLIN